MGELKKKYLYLTNLLTSSSKLVIFILLGLILIGFGVIAYKIDLFASGDSVEVLTPTTEPQNNNQIVVEITGAVEKAGVFKLGSGARIDDLLISAGGLSVDADRNWVEKNINRAAKLVDGQKLYIYHSGESSANNNGGIKQYQEVIGYSVQGLVNINTGSQSELEKLVGIGPVYAQKIIEGRIYSNVEELVTKGVISQKVFEKIKNEISVY